MFTVFSRSRRFRQHQRAISIPIPHPPWGNKTRCALELDDARADDVERFGRRKVEFRPWLRFRGSHRDELDLSATIRVAVALLVRPVKCLLEVALDGHRQLEGLPRVTQVCVAFRGEVGHVCERAYIWHDPVAPLLA